MEEALYSLEDNWTDIVESHAQLSERLKAQQTALWELISTELAYIRTLKVIQDVGVSSPPLYYINCSFLALKEREMLKSIGGPLFDY